MAEHGVVTIMHADVEGSTELTTRLGDEVGRQTLEATKRIVRERAETFGGRQVDAVGDAMMFTFTSTRQAIAGAIAVQRALATEERERPGETLRVRIGLNVGEVLARDGHPVKSWRLVNFLDPEHALATHRMNNEPEFAGLFGPPLLFPIERTSSEQSAESSGWGARATECSPSSTTERPSSTSGARPGRAPGARA